MEARAGQEVLKPASPSWGSGNGGGGRARVLPGAPQSLLL